jgi:hypothetical protein
MKNYQIVLFRQWWNAEKTNVIATTYPDTSRPFTLNHCLGAEIGQWYSTGLWTGWSGIGVPGRMGVFLFTTLSRLALGPTQPVIQWVPGALSLGVKQPGHEAGHSPPSSAKVKNAWRYISTPQYAFRAWCSVKSTETTFFTFTLMFTEHYVLQQKRLKTSSITGNFQ